MKGWMNFFVAIVLMTIASGCGKYEDGPFLSLRSKNARIEGKWKLVEYSSTSVSSMFPEDNETYSFDGTNMSYQYSDVTFDPFTGNQVITPMSETYPYALSFEFNVKNNNFVMVETTGTSTDTNESYWSWQDGANSHEMIEIDGLALAIKKLTNKEMILFYEITSSGGGDQGSSSVEWKFEKQ